MSVATARISRGRRRSFDVDDALQFGAAEVPFHRRNGAARLCCDHAERLVGIGVAQPLDLAAVEVPAGPHADVAVEIVVFHRNLEPGADLLALAAGRPAGESGDIESRDGGGQAVSEERAGLAQRVGLDPHHVAFPTLCAVRRRLCFREEWVQEQVGAGDAGRRSLQ